MQQGDQLAEEFQRHRSHLQAVAYRLLGSLSEAEDAVQESWLRLSRSDASVVENLRAWLTTVVARVCIDMLRSRKTRREEAMEPLSLETRAGLTTDRDPEKEVVLADSIGVALLVLLEQLSPAERISFVLHDVFGMPFEEIAGIVDRSTVAAKKLASRARQRIQGRTDTPIANLRGQREIVEAFLAASRSGDMNGLLRVLDPAVIRRADAAVGIDGKPSEIRGASAVSQETLTNSRLARYAGVAIIDGRLGIVVFKGGQLLVALRLKLENDRITEMDVIAEPARLRRLQIAIPE